MTNLVSDLAPEALTEDKIRRQKFSLYEDNQLRSLVAQFGSVDWNSISLHMEGRTARQCRDRWNHYLAPSTNNTEWTVDEEVALIKQLKQVGKQWTYLASLFPGRTSIGVRNHACKISRRMNADPMIKELLKDEYKKKKANDSRKEIENSINRVVLPPCKLLVSLAISGESQFKKSPFDIGGISVENNIIV